MLKMLNTFNLINYKKTLVVTFLLALVIDQVSKNFFYVYFLFNSKSIELTSFFSLTFVWNKGMSFSILNTQHFALNIAISILALTLILVMLLKHFNTKSIYFSVALGCLLAGSLGNVIDRARFFAVIDFLHLHYKGYSFPVFNFADVFINIAVLLIFFDQYKSNKKV